MAKYEQYAKYKDSGVEWLGEIPSEWSISSIKYLSTLISTGGTPKNQISFTDEQEINWFTPSDFSGDFEIRTSAKYVTFDSVRCGESKLYPSNAILMIGIGATLGKIAICKTDFSCNQQINIIVPNKSVTLEFLAYSLIAQLEQIKQSSNSSTIGIINQDKTKQLVISLPAFIEQNQIIKYLDHETAQIDILIAKQEKLIELLKEKRQAVISHAVTKGLNPDVTMKDSGVEWLGEVPEHWTVSKFKYFASIQGGFAFSSDLFIEEGTQVLRIGNVYQNSLSLERQPIFIANDLVKNFQDFIVKKNDVLMSLTGTLGKRDYGFAIKVETDDQYLLNQRVAKISPNKNIDTDFMVYVLWSESYLTQLYSLPSGTKQANLSNSDVLGIEIVVPQNMQEQKEIARYIKEKLEKFDEMIAKAKSAIQLMQERRTALISSAVTGKIDVRNWQAPHKNNKANTEKVA